MSNRNQFNWVDFYKEFAKKLLNYKHNRQELIDKIKNIYSEIHINLPTLERDNNIIDIDPFTVFGLFNKSSMTEQNRIKIITAIAKQFGVISPIPTSFDSIPTINNLNATFYWFIGERSDGDIDNLWELFDSALQYASNKNDIEKEKLLKYFDLVINTKGNGNSKITMGLYWIAPNFFINLDSRNIWYIYDSGKLPIDIVNNLPKIEGKISSAIYFEIAQELIDYLASNRSKLKDFKELSFEAWKYSEEVNQQKKEEKIKSQRDAKGSALADEDVDTTHYWIYSPGSNASKWDEFYKKDIMAIKWGIIGDLSAFSNKDEMKESLREYIDPNHTYQMIAHATWQFVHEIKIGDIVFAKKGKNLIIGRGIITSDYIYDPYMSDGYNNVRKIDWTDIGEWEHPGDAAVKTLTDITPYTDYVEKMNALFENDEEDDLNEQEKNYPSYSIERFLEEVFMDANAYITLVNLVRNKKNVILQGAPGVGKTYAAKRLAYSMMGVKDQDRVMMVQFHQSYTYEDFIEGFRPSDSGLNFKIKKGSFYNFCKKAADDLDNEYFFIIDEINRGNLSKIFGELFMLIENDKRGNALNLLYSDEKFFVPNNVYIIGMMNTADRSLAMLDYALRRRFAFYEMNPGFDSDGFRTYRMSLNNQKFDNLILTIDTLNAAIKADDTLGEGFCIGHSYFCNLDEVKESTLSSIIEFELIPLLKEYWFDEPLKVKEWTNNLRSVIQ